MSKELTPICVCPLVSSYTVGGCRCSACKELARKWRRTPEQKRRRALYESRPEVRAARNEYTRRRYKNPTLRKKAIEDYAKREARLAALVNQIKLERGCYDCGYSLDASALQFDHVRGIKAAPISTLVHKCSEKKLIEELAKCEVRCANCHSIRTRERRRTS